MTPTQKFVLKDTLTEARESLSGCSALVDMMDATKIDPNRVCDGVRALALILQTALDVLPTPEWIDTIRADEED